MNCLVEHFRPRLIRKKAIRRGSHQYTQNAQLSSLLYLSGCISACQTEDHTQSPCLSVLGSGCLRRTSSSRVKWKNSHNGCVFAQKDCACIAFSTCDHQSSQTMCRLCVMVCTTKEWFEGQTSRNRECLLTNHREFTTSQNHSRPLPDSASLN